MKTNYPQTWKEGTRRKKQILFLPNKYNFYTLDRVETEHFAAFYHISFLWLESAREDGASKYGRIMKKKANILVQMILSAEFEPLSTTFSMKYFCKCHLSRCQKNFARIGRIFNKIKVL